LPVIEASRALAARAYFALCLAFGRMLRSARYSTVQFAHEDGQRLVRKHRRFYASLLIWMSGPLVRSLDGGVQVLPQREWHERERHIYRTVYDASVRVDAEGILILPLVPGQTLATLLEDPELEESLRTKAMECAATALAHFHRLGFTHGDAMAENVLVDLEAGAAHWFDFETLHDPSRPRAWRRADDLRALLMSCAIRTAPEKRAQAFDVILDAYDDQEVTRVLAASVTTVWRRSLSLHLLQAAMSYRGFREMAQMIRTRVA
jgi:hypothetical protein